MEALHPGVIHFVGEQDGEVEREFKSALVPVLSKYQVKRAYLSRVTLGNTPEVGVALCLTARRRMSLVREAAEIFRVRFAADVHFDILFLDRYSREEDVSSVCQPFYVA